MGLATRTGVVVLVRVDAEDHADGGHEVDAGDGAIFSGVISLSSFSTAADICVLRARS